MISLINAYKKMDPSAQNTWEILLLYPGVKAILFHRFAHFLYQHRIPFLPRMVAEFSRWLTGIEIHPGARIGRETVFDHGMGIVIGETAIVGNRVLIYHGVTLGATSMNISGKRHPTIEDDVVLGSGCKILGNIVIRENSRIGANSVVLKDIPANSTAAGIPARIVNKNAASFKEWGNDFQI